MVQKGREKREEEKSTLSFPSRRVAFDLRVIKNGGKTSENYLNYCLTASVQRNEFFAATDFSSARAI